jgi:hypothetical protein
MRGSFIVAALAFTAVAGSLSAQTTARDSADLVRLNRGYVDAFLHSDSAWYNAHLAPGFICITTRGAIVSRADFVAGSAGPVPYKSFELDSVSITLLGDVALASAITPWELPDGTKGVTRYVDTWIRRKGVWKTQQAQLTRIIR